MAIIPGNTTEDKCRDNQKRNQLFPDSGSIILRAETNTKYDSAQIVMRQRKAAFAVRTKKDTKNVSRLKTPKSCGYVSRGSNP